MSRDLRRLLTVVHDRNFVYAMLTAFALSWSASPLQAQPAEVRANLPIDAVTVYASSASITRSGEVAIPAGASTLILEDLPGWVNPSLLRLTISDSGVQFSNLQIQESYQEEDGNSRANELRGQLQTLQDQRQVIDDRIATAQSELRLLDNLTGGDAGSRPAVTGDELATLITVMSENATQARERIRSANIELRGLDQQIEEVQFQLNQVAGNRRSNSRVRINLQSDNAVSTNVTVTYPQGDVSWGWLYEARLDTASRRLSLFRQAAISQGTGADWRDVTMTLSTATPRSNPATPELQPQFVDNQPQVRLSEPGPREVEEVIVTGSAIRGTQGSASLGFTAATMVDTRYQVDYVIPGRVSLAADRQPQVFPIDRTETQVELVSRAVPSRIPQAYLEARFDYGGETPIQSARMQLYRDGALIGSAGVQQMLPGQSVRIPFGVDQRIEVARFDEQQESGSAGIFNRSDVRETRMRYEITSRHPQTVPVEVLDQIPVSRNEDIRVEIPRQATAADETDVGGQAGLMLWQLELEPQETATIRHYYDLRYPQGSNIYISP